MSNQDYAQKKHECWEQFWHEVNGSINRCPETYEDLEAAFYTAFDRAYALGKEKEPITQEDVEKASVEYADKTAKQYEVCNSEFVQEIMVAFEQGANFALGKKFGNSELFVAEGTVISGWVFTDDITFDLILRVHKVTQGDWESVWDSGEPEFCLGDKLLPDDMAPIPDPEPVEITIKRKKK